MKKSIFNSSFLILHTMLLFETIILKAEDDIDAAYIETPILR